MSETGVRRVTVLRTTLIMMLGLVLLSTGVISASGPVVVSFVLGDNAKADGLEPIDYSSGKWHISEVAGRQGVELEMKNLYLQVDDSRLYGGPYKIVVTLDYISTAEGQFKLEYDSMTNDYSYEKGPNEVIDAEKVGKWNQVVWTFEGVQFSNRQNGKSDMRIRISQERLPLLFGAIKIEATPQP